MVNTKVDTVIVNRTQHELILRVGNQNCMSKLATIVVEGEHILHIDINWTYQEFSLEPTTPDVVMKKILLSSDDCCDYERMTVTIADGEFQVDKVSRGCFQTNNFDNHRLSTPDIPEGPNKKSYFTWPRTWLKVHWKFWTSA